jgi:hypothetical protein
MVEFIPHAQDTFGPTIHTERIFLVLLLAESAPARRTIEPVQADGVGRAPMLRAVCGAPSLPDLVRAPRLSTKAEWGVRHIRFICCTRSPKAQKASRAAKVRRLSLPPHT